MKKQNECYTSFSVSLPKTLMENFIQELGIENFEKKESRVLCDEVILKIGKNYNYDVDISSMIIKSLSVLFEKEEVLKTLKEKYNLHYYIEVVPSLYSKNITPSFFFNKTIIDFCYKTETEIDVDLYLLSNN
ncbi:MAG: hypothetical protein IJW82_04830 [Clostridia bacterium]|nr:hypothetical protein [Clostridia bacterium]